MTSPLIADVKELHRPPFEMSPVFHRGPQLERISPKEQGITERNIVPNHLALLHPQQLNNSDISWVTWNVSEVLGFLLRVLIGGVPVLLLGCLGLAKRKRICLSIIHKTHLCRKWETKLDMQTIRACESVGVYLN